MRLSFKKVSGLVLSVVICSFAAFQIHSIYQSARKTLADERARLNRQNRVVFEKINLTPHLSEAVEILQNISNVRDLVKFQNSYFAATSGGLAQFTVEGKLIKHFTVLDGLPDSDLTCLANYNGKLYIGTRTADLVVFDGAKFENYIWKDRKGQAITSFLESNGRLLIGTITGGLLEFDGKDVTEIKAENQRITAVNCLYRKDTELFVGTFDNGLWRYKNDVWTHFTTVDGLPSNRVVGIVFQANRLYAGTDFGLAVLEEKTFRTAAELPALSSLAAFNDQLFLTRDNGEIFIFDDSIKRFSLLANLQNSKLTVIDNKFWLLTNRGISEIKGAKFKVFGESEANSITDNFVTAMTFDSKNNLWLGTFRRGIDVFSAAGKKIKHLETDNLREINYLHTDGEKISAATLDGLLTFKKDFSFENTSKKDVLPSISINQTDGANIATAKGLAISENNHLRLISTVQGLPNNSIYSILQVKDKLYAGTLGGLAIIENGRVTKIFKDSNSNLTTNWVTALCVSDERLFVGTYGGGIFELLPSGEIRALAAETGKFVVNPNAMLCDGKRLYAGTLDGVKILDLQTQEWKTLSNLLPSQTVLSITENDTNVYFGTTNGVARIEKSYFENGAAE